MASRAGKWLSYRPTDLIFAARRALASIIAYIFRREFDDCAGTADDLARRHEPVEALQLWMQRFSAFFATKRDLRELFTRVISSIQHCRVHFEARLRPALQNLLASASAKGRIRSDIAPNELLGAIARLSISENADPAQAQRMVALLANGLLL
ncbi:TetR family transcriptional regulator [Rhizobium sp. AC27/96]|uniref:SbtR family transcriptional regulator n=1 Tax=Rhizobium sp. AC27/96 TaxID=1841653 RepID=UPI0011465E23|nr:TetR family transcriptional regulator [Rhizobium sp. AC27/96]